MTETARTLERAAGPRSLGAVLAVASVAGGTSEGSAIESLLIGLAVASVVLGVALAVAADRSRRADARAR